MALRFRAVSIEATVANPDPYHRRRGGPRLLAEERVVRKDGAIGPRTLVITWYPPDEESPTAEVSCEGVACKAMPRVAMPMGKVSKAVAI